MTEATTAPRKADFVQLADVHQRISGENFSLAQVGSFDELGRYGIRHPATGGTLRGKVFLKQVLDLCGMEISFGSLPANASMPFYHKHQQNEEVYLFLSGEGQFQVDGQVVDISPGCAARVAPDGVRALRNTSDAEMHYICVQAKAGSLEQWTGTDGVGVPGEVRWPDAAAE